MKIVKNIAVMLVLALLMPAFAISADASGSYGFNSAVAPVAVKPGEQAEVTLSLTGYTAEAAQTDAIRGLQIDITGIDTDILNVVEYISLINDTDVLSNKASYNSENSRVRLLYVNSDSALEAPCEQVLKVVFQVSSTLEQNGCITLPVTIKIQTENQQITLADEITIFYSTETVAVSQVDITWGTMGYEYSDGIWNSNTHSYDNMGWSDNGSGFIIVQNTGDTATTAQFVYGTDRTDIMGAFTDGIADITEAVTVEAGSGLTAYLTLSGKPSEILDNTTIGTVTVTIGGE